jgi:hypothetical protein
MGESVAIIKNYKKPLTTETQRHREKHENQLFLEQINLMRALYFYRHCEERSDVAIQTVSWIATSLRSSQ